MANPIGRACAKVAQNGKSIIQGARRVQIPPMAMAALQAVA